MKQETLVKLGSDLLSGASLFQKVQDVYRNFCSACKAEGVPFKDKTSGVMVVACQAIQATKRGAELWPMKDEKFMGHSNALKAAKEMALEADKLPKGKKRDEALKASVERIAILKMIGAFSQHLSLFESYEDLFTDNRKVRGKKETTGNSTGEVDTSKNSGEENPITEKRKEDHKSSEAFSVIAHLPEFIAFLSMDGEARKNPQIVAIAETLRDIYLKGEEQKKAA